MAASTGTRAAVSAARTSMAPTASAWTKATMTTPACAWMKPPSTSSATATSSGRRSDETASSHLRRAGDLAHLPGLEILEGLEELGPRVHDERSVARDGLADRRSREEQEPARPACAAQPHRRARSEHRHLALADLGALCSGTGRPLEHVDEGRQMGGDLDADVRARLERPVLQHDRRAGLDHRARPQRLAGDDTHRGLAVRAPREGKLAARILLVTRP